jgi:hypothetical protein
MSSKLSAPHSSAQMAIEQEVFKLVQPGALDTRIGQSAQDAEEIDSVGEIGFWIAHPKRVSEPIPKIHFCQL